MEKNQTDQIFIHPSPDAVATAHKISEFVLGPAEVARLKASHPRPPSEISGAIMDRIMAPRREVTPSPEFAGGVRALPRGRFRLPAMEISAAGLELLACAARRMGWSLEKFILDAAVCRAQEIRDACARASVSFSDLGDLRATTSDARDNSALALTHIDINPDLRVTHGVHGIPVNTAVNDNDRKDGVK
jgi:hypothetical protein